MKKTIVLAGLIFSTNSTSEEIDSLNIISAVSKERDSIQIIATNKKDYDIICSNISHNVKFETYGTYEELGSEKKEINNLYFRHDKISAQKISISLRQSIKNLGNNGFIRSSQLDYGASTCQKSSLVDFCKYADKSKDDQNTLKVLMKINDFESCDDLEKIEKIKYLNISGQNIRSLKPVYFLKSLENINISSNPILSIDKLLEKNENLKSIDIENTQISSIRFKK